MKVVFVAPVFWPATKYGGPVYTSTALVKALSKQNAEVVVITGNMGNNGKLDYPTGKPVYLDTVKVIYLDQQWTQPYGRLRGLISTLERESRDAHIIHLSSTLTRTTWEAARWAISHGLPYVVTTRGHLIRRNAWKDLKKTIAVKTIIGRYLRNAEFLQATSPYEAEELEKYGFNNVVVVPHGIDLPEILPSRDKARKDWGVSNSDIVIVTLGRIHPVKQIDLLIQAIGNLANHKIYPKLIIPGDGNPNYVKKLKGLANQYGVSDQCKFTGIVNGDQKWSLMSAGDLFVHLSSGESFGVAIGEALASGLPVIIGKKCGWNQIEEMGTGVHVESDPEIVSDTLESFIKNLKHHKNRNQALASRIREDFSWDRIAAAMLTNYNTAINDRGI